MPAKDMEEQKHAQPSMDLDEDSSGPYSSGFAEALQLSVRAAIMMSLLASLIWVPSFGKSFINSQILARVPLMICLFVFTINPLLGTAIQNACCGIIGTFWACFHMWVMNGIFPGGMKEGMSSTGACAIFGWSNFLIITFLCLWCKCGLGTKMFFLATHIGFMLCFLDPKSAVGFSENFTISHRGTAVNTMLATFLGCACAPIMNLIPYPMSMSYANMKTNAVKASHDTGRLFEAVIIYYAGHESSIVVESQLKHSLDLRAHLDTLGGAIGGAWWEGFDLGTRGTVRALMDSHCGLMNNVYDRVAAVLVVARSEDFGPSHIAIMDKVHDECLRLAAAVKHLLIAVTNAATDGDISAQEKAELSGLVDEAKAALSALAAEFDVARKALRTPISTEALGENYFVLTISAYARLVIDYSEMMMTNPPKGAGFGAAMVSGLKSTWDFSAMTERFSVSFTVIHYAALVFCWFYSVYVDHWGGGCVITAVFLMSPAVCPDIQAFLNVLNAVILAVVAGTLVYQWSCGSGYGDYILPFVSLIFWIVSLYGYFAKSLFLLPCLVFAALTPFRFVAECPKGEVAAGARATWGVMVANIIAIAFVCSFQYFMGTDRANRLAICALDDAFGGLRTAFDAFWAEQDATVPMGSVSGSLGAGLGFSTSAMIEPRFFRDDWKAGLYTTVAGQASQIRLDILMLWFAMAGSDGKPDAIFSKFDSTPDFVGVRNDLNSTLEDAHALSIAMLKHEAGHFTGLSALKNTTGIDTLGDLPNLIKNLSGMLRFPSQSPDSLEDDELCQISSVCFLLDCSIKHIAAVLKTNIRQV